MDKKRLALKKRLSLLFVVLMLFTFIPIPLPNGMESVGAAEITLHNPMRDNGKVTYDCVWFGSYPQAEVVTADLLKKYEAEVYESEVWDKKVFRVSDFIVDDTIYQTLEKAGNWDADGNITLANGEKYRRIKKDDVTRTDFYSGGSLFIDWENDNTYHYFKYQPIKWKVLSTNMGEALLLAECGLDCQKYHMDEGESVTWEMCTIRSWLNGYGSAANKRSIDYTTENFINSAFDSLERNVIKTKKIENKEYEYGNARKIKNIRQENFTNDKIFLLSYDNATNTDYGFSAYKGRQDKAKQIWPSAYARAQGAPCFSNSKGVGGKWVLRSVFGEGDGGDLTMLVNFVGMIDNAGIANGGLIVPALYLDISAFGLWSYAGTVSVRESKNGIVEESGKNYYYKNNTKRVNYTGLTESPDGKWYYIKNGVWQSEYTGLMKKSNNKWYYVENGIRKNTTGLVKHTDGKWWYVKKGVWQSKYTGMVKQPSGRWYYVKDGKKKYSTGLVKHKDGKWWYVRKSEWQPKYTGIVKLSNDKSYYVKKGKKNYLTGYITVKGKRYKLEKGEVKSK